MERSDGRCAGSAHSVFSCVCLKGVFIVVRGDVCMFVCGVLGSVVCSVVMGCVVCSVGCVG